MKRWSRFSAAGAVALALLMVPALLSGPPTAGAQTCTSETAPTPDPYPGTTVAAANFEGGSLDRFQVFTAGTGAVSLSSTTAHSGTCAVLLHTTRDTESIAKLSVGLPAGTREVYADAWFNIATEGAVGSNIPYLRIFSEGTRVMDVFRQNVSHELVLRVNTPEGYTYTSLARNVGNGIWHRLVLHVVPNGPATGVQVWWDGRSVFESTSVAITATTADTVQLGSEHDKQMGDIYVDDLVVNGNSGVPGPVPGDLPVNRPDMLKRPGVVDDGSSPQFLAGAQVSVASARPSGESAGEITVALRQ